MEDRHSPVGWWEYNRHTHTHLCWFQVILICVPQTPGKDETIEMSMFTAEVRSGDVASFVLLQLKRIVRLHLSLCPLRFITSSSSQTPTRGLRVDGRRGEHNKHFGCQLQCKKVADADTQHPTGGCGSKVCLMTTLNHRLQKISSPLLLISSNDVPVGWHAVCQPYCHYNALFSLFPLFCVWHDECFMLLHLHQLLFSLPCTSAHSHFYFPYVSSLSTEIQQPECEISVCGLKWSAITTHAEIKIRGWRNNFRSTYQRHHFRLVLLLTFD